MKAKEKARELVDTYFNDYGEKDHKGRVMLCIVSVGRAKQCALICARTHIYSENNSPFNKMKEWKTDNDFWLEVMIEINQINA